MKIFFLIGIVLTCLLMSVTGGMSATEGNAGILCDGNVEAQETVTNSWDYSSEMSQTTYYYRSRFIVHYDCIKQPDRMSFSVYNTCTQKQNGVRWHYDENEPYAVVIPDSVQEVFSVKEWKPYGGTEHVVGTATVTVVKKGSCDGTTTDSTGKTDTMIDITITDTSQLSGRSDELYFSIGGGNIITDYYKWWYCQPLNTVRDAMYATQGFVVGNSGHHGALNCLTGGVYGDCSPTDGWTLSTHYNFKNYYIVTETPASIEVSVHREAGLDSYMVKSKIRSYDMHGSLVTESGWSTENEVYTLSLASQEIFIVPDFEDDTTELFICAYQEKDNVKISGHTYNAETGEKLSSVTVRTADMNYEYVDSSDSYGFYSISFPPSIYTITANRDGYYDAVLDNLPFPDGGDYHLDISLAPKPPVENKPSILGLVRMLPHYYPAKNQAVAIKNSTWSAITTTNEFGYYLFPNLEAGNYYIDVLRRGYKENHYFTTISDFHVLHIIDLEPKEANIIEIVVEKIIEWRLLLLLVIALVIGGLLVRGKKTHHRRR